MVASTDIKFYVHTNNNAPQLQNAYGSMINVLDACLINGIQIGVVSSLTVSGNTVTATFGAAHNLMQYQVIKITGAAQAEFNGEHRILTIPDSSSLTFELATAPSVPTATGTISASLPPLGWEKPFSSSNPNGGGKAAYRSLNLLLPSRPFLRVVDELDPVYTATYAKYAKVGIVEDMTDIDTMLGVQAPFDAVNPDKNWVGTGSGTSAINGWAKWYYARGNPLTNTNETTVPVSGDRPFLVVGSSDYFYIFNNPDPAGSAKVAYGFGSFKSYIATDTANNFLAATLRDTTAASATQVALYSSITTDRAVLCLQRQYSQVALPVNDAKILSLFQTASGYVNNVEAALVSNQIPSAPVFINDGTLRGKLPLIQWLFQQTPYLDNTLISEGKEVFIALRTVSTGFSIGQILVRIA
ncbi:hypothetical protein [Acinetobacter sp. YH01026]|uniref:hypothetical protein n=1 Tax=Acinetobacter sp. YH01026 TaxID=2601039 RepID=UPI0015D2705E|nr:hypothetical protein [Acinetobacter sp. YH01026]